MDKFIEDIEFTIFDTETTGLEPESGDRIVEIAAVRLKGKEIISKFESLVNPHREISSGAFNVNHISQEMLRDAPSIEKVLPHFLDFIRGSCLCSYNANFDLGFLDNELRLLGQPNLTDIVVVDILKMAKRLTPRLERYALWFVAEKMGIKQKQQHRAFSDVEITLELFNKFKEVLSTKGIYDYRNFINLFGINTALVNDINSQKLAKIQEAIDLKVRLRIHYLSSASAEVTEREVSPREIRQEKGTSYLVGYCSLRQDERTFRVDSILHLEIV